MSELKPCPFCGSAAIIEKYPAYNQPDGQWIECGNYKCWIKPAHSFKTKKSAIRIWNTRAPLTEE